jgi:hypothetical protein
MDINKLLKAGMRECGRVLNVLPKEDIGSPTEYMMNVLRDETIPSLDIIHPVILKKTFHVGNLIPVHRNDSTFRETNIPNHPELDDRYSMFRIPSELVDGHEIMTIKSLVPVGPNSGPMMNGYNQMGNNFNEMPWTNHWGRANVGDMYGAVISAQISFADRQLVGSISRNFRHYFYPPNILLITNYNGPLNGSFCVKNDENLITMDDMAYDAVRRLFLLDLKKCIFNEYGNYTEIDTPLGTFDLKISNWESAETDRNEYYETLRATSHFRTSSIRS